MAKYSGVWTPDMGDGADDAKASGVPSPNRFYSKQFDDYRRRQENRARLAAWMHGYEPVSTWERLGADPLDFALFMQFPTTKHEVGVMESAERGRVLVWCFGCQRPDCGAARWAEQEFRANIKVRRTLTKDDDTDGLPF